ncbi:SAM hydrolase/SAM-dependent halogenase family protein [Aquimarina agarilytica]|uniref:SAM hydrolase/SAM-dependent halogenase family protein n=1 Tax=Aquimarina agarilytica TaxID=1087449 RepID=UPI00028A266E|nr:SAM-dependent chlorinase/fluorinase [Aquimarina agarilytica]
MSIITLTTDFGNKDHSVAAVKGAIYSELPEATVVDISHQVSPFHIEEGAYIIKNAYKNFPKGTIHIIGIDSELTPENKHIAVLLDGHYFICADNGIISLITSEFKPENLVEISLPDTTQGNFPTLDTFVRVACHLSRGGTLEVIGKRINDTKVLTVTAPVVNQGGNQIVGSVIYIDNYGNVITNVTRSFFENIQKGRHFKITARRVDFSSIVNKYSEAINFTIEKSKREEDGKKIALFNTCNFLELAIYRSDPNTCGAASTLFGLKYRDTITITFED